jgi:hypothetical protein
MKTVAFASLLSACLAAAAAAQAPEPKPVPVQAPAPSSPDESVNIRYQIVIRETGGTQARTKTVGLTMGLGSESSVRAQGTAPSRTNHPLNVDIAPVALRGNRVRTRVGIEYTPQMPEGTQGPPPLFVRESLTVWLEGGKPMVISEAADPLTDRRIGVEVTATIIR